MSTSPSLQMQLPMRFLRLCPGSDRDPSSFPAQLQKEAVVREPKRMCSQSNITSDLSFGTAWSEMHEFRSIRCERSFKSHFRMIQISFTSITASQHQGLRLLASAIQKTREGCGWFLGLLRGSRGKLRESPGKIAGNIFPNRQMLQILKSRARKGKLAGNLGSTLPGPCPHLPWGEVY